MGNTEVVNQVVEPTEASVIETAVEFEPIVVEPADAEAERAIIEPVAIAELSVESESRELVGIAELELSEPITATTVNAPLETTVEPEPIVIAAPEIVESVTLTALEHHVPIAIAEEPIPTEPILSELTSNQLTPLLALIECPNTASFELADPETLEPVSHPKASVSKGSKRSSKKRQASSNASRSKSLI